VLWKMYLRQSDFRPNSIRFRTWILRITNSIRFRTWILRITNSIRFSTLILRITNSIRLEHGY